MLTWLDSWSHVKHWEDYPVLRRVQRWLCYRYDRSCGLSKAEARS